MFGENESQKELRDKWPTMSYNEKVNTFLWKMSWYHSHIHIPGAPPHKAINNLADMLKSATEISEKLTKSIRVATWVGGIAATVGVIMAIVSLFKVEILSLF